ncbi:hypothetical protein AVEN_15983-1 [Araneus ventricosus]|uniref:Uncharacterized protein n=1 Tax=Araneus ventricosus TaxID=182803 RepID=A0A4Y2FP69_ARAVE|nr:hypothetical protein AVEN_260584-1 [Araneus ventricosus]GBM43282.1 hypothetical protein AVEN_15983-1 [Araneus ventricosus]
MSEGSAPVHLDRFAFRWVIHEGSKTHYRPLRSPPSKQDPRSPSSTSDFRFCEGSYRIFSRIVIQLYNRMRQMRNERRWISKLLDHNSPILIGFSH